MSWSGAERSEVASTGMVRNLFHGFNQLHITFDDMIDNK
jgi:hypothetical protein